MLQIYFGSNGSYFPRSCHYWVFQWFISHHVFPEHFIGFVNMENQLTCILMDWNFISLRYQKGKLKVESLKVLKNNKEIHNFADGFITFTCSHASSIHILPGHWFKFIITKIKCQLLFKFYSILSLGHRESQAVSCCHLVSCLWLWVAWNF